MKGRELLLINDWILKSSIKIYKNQFSLRMGIEAIRRSVSRAVELTAMKSFNRMLNIHETNARPRKI